jgi:hypothetical protein
MVVMDQKSGKFIQFSRFVPLLAWNFRPIKKIIATPYLPDLFKSQDCRPVEVDFR